MYTFQRDIAPVTRSLTWTSPEGNLLTVLIRPSHRFLADCLQRSPRGRQGSNPAGQTGAAGTQTPRAGRVPTWPTVGKASGQLWPSRSQEAAQGPWREAVQSASGTDDQSLPLCQQGTSLPRQGRASRRDQGSPQARRPYSKPGTLRRRVPWPLHPPWLKEGPSRALPGARGAGAARPYGAPEHMCLRTRWSAHACMCACLEGGGKFSLQV